MRRIITLVLLLTIINSSKSLCQYNNLEFTENKGQWDARVKFKGDFTTGAFFLMEKGFRVFQNKPEDLLALADMYHGVKAKSATPQRTPAPTKEKSVTVHSHAYDVQFVNAQTPQITADKPIDSYNNYFIGNDQSKWKGGCRIFQGITYKSIYPHVDIRYYTNDGKLKYDIIVNAKADVNAIAMKYEGADALHVKDRQLIVTTSLGDSRELAPYAYQVINGVKKEVECNFRVIGKTVSFALGDYDKNATLIIDPTLIFSTFTGSTADNWGYTATYGTDGSFYAGGTVFQTGFPVSPGAAQTTYSGGIDEGGIGGYDIGIMKFNPSGSNRVYATYIGGSGNEQPHSMIADAAGNLVIAGRSNSSDSTKGFPLGPNGIKQGSLGAYDIVVTKLNPAGTAIIGAIMIGGKGNDGANIGPKYVDPQGELSIRRNYGDDARSEVLFDASGNILVASNSQSDNFPLTAPFQGKIGGQQDGIILSLTPNLSQVLVSSYIGGIGDDAAFVLAINPSNGAIYVGGNTTSNNLPGSKTGVLQPTFQGGTDGFVSVLSADAKTLQKTSYFGTTAFDMLYGIQFDKKGFPYIMGSTTGSWTVKNATYVEAGGKQFISKLLPDLSDYVYSTVFGTNSAYPNISPIAFLVDKCENVYVSGWGGEVNIPTGFNSAGTFGMTVTSDAYKGSTDGSDFYFFVLAKNATGKLYASFFGQNGGLAGEHVDGGTSRFDSDGTIYQALCANCGNDVPFPTTPGAYSRVNGSTNCNLAAVKMAFNLSGIAGSVRSSIQGSTQDTVGCVPLRVNFSDTLNQGKLFIWSYGDGSKKDTTTLNTTSHVFNAIGKYKVMLVSIDSSKCNIADTATTFINVKTFKAELDFDWQKLPPCDSFKYEFFNKSTVVPNARPFGPTSFVWDFGDGTPPVVAGMNSVIHNFPISGTYNVKLRLVDTNFCNAPVDTTKRLSIATLVKAGFDTPEAGCAPYEAYFNNISIAGDQFNWNFGDGTTSTAENPTHLYTIPGTYIVKLVVYSAGTCNKIDSTTFKITVYGKPVASFFFNPNPPQENRPVDFTNTSTGSNDFVWFFGDGDSLLIKSTATVRHTYNKTDTFRTCLVALTNSGCPDTTCQFIPARVLPLLDVPNAFTPNFDGINDKVYVRGFGIASMLWRIYNRWGRLIYESTDKNQGWDGKFKGEMQPTEVYHYTLDVLYTDDSRVQKKGDITLLR